METKVKSEQVADIQGALETLLRAIDVEDERRREELQRDPADQRIRHQTVISNAPVEELRFRPWISDPVRHALYQGVKALGAHLFGIVGNTDEMRQVLDNLIKLDPVSARRRETIVSQAWRDVGSGDDVWRP